MLTLCPHQGVLEGDGHDTELPGSGDTVIQEDVEEPPVAADLGPDTRDLEDQSFQQSLPSSPSAGAGPPCLPLALSFEKGWLWE